ncbi:zinc finger CCCH domain-containing protein 37 isoform X2 [Durio zibethinus]|uniref:Zinc finger CCCH domain-containing protein 37 isoform X2 n=1 Tax=Durio zibethinus TaxID=66656 RepID=A0A6P5Z9X3_DURZI|nr:zinc finger CCCH domain-containing protein 37 isoform X2 [Durio zibethinus]
MANQLYGYSSPSPSASLSLRYLDSDSTTHSHFLHHLQPWPPTVDVSSSAAAAPPIKRPSQVLYHQNVLDAHNTIGQIEAWYSTSSLVKRPRFESSSNLPIYPQRPGEKDCAHYMLTRTCKFGDSCKFDHPIWVPEGGIPYWKEVPLLATGESLPERAEEPDCPFFLKTQRCKFGSKCKFNHPKDKLATSGDSENTQVSVLPDRPSEPPCAFYMKTGKCKFGATCKFHHPKDIQIPSFGQGNTKCEQIEAVTKIGGATVDLKPAQFLNSKGLPIRLDEVDCPFYLKTGSCKYGSSCRYNHPDRNAFNPPAAAIGHSLIASANNLNIGVVTPASSLYQTIDPRLSQTTLLAQQTLPTYYMKTGECKFGDRCKFHHPVDRLASTTNETSQQAVKLTLAGFPRREGSVHCPYYMKTGTCKYGATCKFDHPPPGEVMAMAAAQGTPTTIGQD